MLDILVTIPANEEHMNKLAKAARNAHDVRFTVKNQDDLVPEDVDGPDVVIGNIPHDLIIYARKMKWLQLNTAGADGYPDLIPDGVKLTNASGAFGLAISEHMLGMMLMLIKRLHQYRDNQSERLWRDEGPVSSLEDAVVLSVGLGDIGGEFARKCKALGAYTIGIRRSLHDKPDYVDELYTPESIDSLLSRADVIALSVPGTDATQRMVNRDNLKLMKQGAIILNVGRGNALDTDALADYVECGRLLCGLDVTDPEPLPREHKLWSLKNAVITPHVSGFFHLKQTLDRIVDISARNLGLYLAGEPLLNTVDKESGYRSYVGRV